MPIVLGTINSAINYLMRVAEYTVIVVNNLFCDKLLNHSAVNSSSYFDRVYVWPVTVRGSTAVRMFFIGTMSTGYLKDLLGPCG